jgi:hypothetical protein
MTEFILKRTDYTHTDSEKDRRGVHKRTDIINYYPDGWSDHPNWAASSYPVDFVLIKVPGMTMEESQYRDSWRDDFDYEVIATRPVQGEFDIRIFEKNDGASGQNAISGAKASKVRDYLQAWGCSAFSMSAVDATFTFSLWDAVRSENFWEVPLIGTKVSFALNSYTPATGIASVTVTIIDANVKPASVVQKIIQRGGTVTAQDATTVTFELNRSDLVTKFRNDVKRRMEQVYMRHQYAISNVDHDAIVAAGGLVTMTKAEFLSKLIDKMAE